MIEVLVDAQLDDGMDVPADVLTDVEAAVRRTLKHEAVADATISVTLVDDRQISELNERHLNRGGPTDVISFPLYDTGERVVGDVYIDVDQVLRQSIELSVPFDDELARLVIHGTLHVLGYDHPETGSRERSAMWQRQELILHELLNNP